jgi:predicted amidohydrolase YtcJ
MILKRLLLCTAIAASFFSTDVLAGPGRTIYYNGKLFTSNDRQPWAQGLVVEGRSIIAVGSSAQALAFQERDSVLVDLGGRTMIPGFNDAHVHPFDMTSFPRAVKVNNAADFVPGDGPSLQDVIGMIKAAAARTPSGTWIMASIGTKVIGNPEATRIALQDATPDHPVLLASWYGHGTLLNTKAMQVLGISETEPDPFGGSYERFPNSNVITGVAHEYAENLIRRWFANAMTDQEFRTLYATFATNAARLGYTSIQEFSIGLPQKRHLALVEQSDIPIRWRAICFPLTLSEPCDVPPRLASNRPFAKVTASGIKWIVDGTFIERGAFLDKDYADAPGVRGRMNFALDALQTELTRSAKGPVIDLQPMFHTVGDGTSDAILDSMATVASDSRWAVRRPRIEHGTLLRPDRFASARNKGVYVVQNPLHFSLAPTWAVRLSADELAVIDPMKSLLKADIKLAIGSDAVDAPGNPYLDLFFAMIQPTHPSEAISMEQAVTAYTRTAAEAEFQESRKGTLEPGKLADLVVLSQDIFTVPTPQAILATQAILTVVDGRPVYDAGILKPQLASGGRR